MANCRTYMRGLCISFNVLLLMFGVLMIVVGFTSSIKHPTELEYWTNTHGVYLLKIFGPITVFLSVLGAYAAVTDRKPVLILYAVLMSIMFIALITVAAPLIGVQSQLDLALKELFKSAVPLHTAELPFQIELKKLQTTDACCGLQNYTDWGEQVPASCLCVAERAPALTPSHSHNTTFEGPCVAFRVEPKQWHNESGTPFPVAASVVWAYRKPCGPILQRYLDFLIKVVIGLVSAFATVMLAALLLSLVLGTENYWRSPPPDSTPLDDTFSRVKYQLSPLDSEP